MNPERFWILGAGRFGRLAVERITRHIPCATLTVVDRDPSAGAAAGIRTITRDGIEWLYTMLAPNAGVDWIVPAIPVHVAAAWLKCKLAAEYRVIPARIPDASTIPMPNAHLGEDGRLYVSHADFICPDNCPEPEKVCTHTGKPRPKDLYRILEDMDFEAFLPVVLHSHQLYPGVGGIRPADLMDALNACRQHSSHRPLMIATACRCHGVVDFIRLEKN